MHCVIVSVIRLSRNSHVPQSICTIFLSVGVSICQCVSEIIDTLEEEVVDVNVVSACLSVCLSVCLIVCVSLPAGASIVEEVVDVEL